MPKQAEILSHLKVKSLANTKKTKSYTVGGATGLMLQVKYNPEKYTLAVSWILRIKINGKRRNIGLGGFKTLPLSRARKVAISVRQDVKLNELLGKTYYAN